MNIVANSPTATIPTVNRPYRKALYFKRLKSKSGTFPTLARRSSARVNPAIRKAPAMKQTAGSEMFERGHEKLPRVKISLGSLDRKSTRLNSSHVAISYAVFCLKKKKIKTSTDNQIRRNVNR